MTATQTSLREMARAALLARDAEREAQRAEHEIKVGEVLHRLIVARLGYHLPEKPRGASCEYAGVRFRALNNVPNAPTNDRYQLKYWQLSAAYICPDPQDETFVPIHTLADLGDLIEANEGPMHDIPF